MQLESMSFFPSLPPFAVIPISHALASFSEMEFELQSLRAIVSARENEIQMLRKELNATKQFSHSLFTKYHPAATSQILAPSMHHYIPGEVSLDRRPFQEQIDFSSIRLKKSNSNFMTDG